MSKFKVGDIVRRIEDLSDLPVGTICKVTATDSVFINVSVNGEQRGCYSQECFELVEEKTNKTTMSKLTEKFALVFKSEPEKSFIKAGVMNSDETLTPEGKEIFFSWLFKQNQDAFKTAVVDPILAEEEKNNQ